MKYNELSHSADWIKKDGFLVSSELFLDVVFTEKCNRACPFCIANTRQRAVSDRGKWETSLQEVFKRFPVKSVIILGGEATIDPQFWEKLTLVSAAARRYDVDRIVLTTNGTELAKPEFLRKICQSDIDAVNLSRMHDIQERNDAIFSGSTPTVSDISQICQSLRAAGKTFRLNVNIWKGNLDSVDELDVTSAETKATYDEIKAYVLEQTGLQVNCGITPVTILPHNGWNLTFIPFYQIEIIQSDIDIIFSIS